MEMFGICVRRKIRATLACMLAAVAAASCNTTALAQVVLTQAVDRYACESIVLARYLDCEHSHSKTAESFKAYYSVSQVLKGPPCSGRLTINFDMDHRPEGSTVTKARNEGGSTLPKKGSQWIIFIPYSVPKDGSFETFNGSKGRIEYSEKVFEQVVDDLKKRGEFRKSEL